MIETLAMVTMLFGAASVVNSLESDYPEEALRNQEQGTVTVELVLGADGKPSSCKVTMPSTSAILNDATCPFLVARAHHPELAPKAPRIEAQTVDWRIPPPNPIAAVKMGTVTNFTIDDRGTVSKCKERLIGDQYNDELWVCDTLLKKGDLYNFVANKLPRARASFIRLYIEPIRIDSSTIIQIASANQNLKIAEFTFDITQTGFVRNCEVRFIDPMFSTMNMCLAFDGKYPLFKPEKIGKPLRKMRFIMDAGSISAHATKDK